MSIKVKYLDIPDESREGVEAEGQGQSFSKAEAVLTGLSDGAYATLEPFGWPLDGKRQVLPDTPGPMWWSSISSDENGSFSQPPQLTVRLKTPCTATGISITFAPEADEYCSRVRFNWLRGTVLLAQLTAESDGPYFSVSQTVENFDTVRVEFLQTSHPHSFVKVKALTVGIAHWFFADEITSVSAAGESDHLLSSLPVDTLTVTLRDKKGRDLRPRKNQKLQLYRDDTLLATAHIADSTREDGNSYRIHCQSILGLLEDDFLGGIYENVPVDVVLKQILTGIDYAKDPYFDAASVTGYLPVCTRRQALQQVAFALGAAVRTDASGRVLLLPPEGVVHHAFRKDRIFRGQRIKTQTEVSRIELSAHSFRPSEEREELLRNQALSGENVLFTFKKPHHSYSVTGGTITESGENFVRLTAKGEVSLSAGTYVQSTSSYVRENPAFGSTEQGNTLTVTEATLVHPQNAEAVLNRLWEGAALRQELTFQAVVTDQMPGQLVTAEDPWGGLVRGYITAMDWQLGQTGQTAGITVCGSRIPVQIAQFYSGELTTEEGVEHLCS